MSTESLIALGVAGAATLLAVGAIVFCVLAIRRERIRRHHQVSETAWQSMGGAATRDDLRALQGRLSEVVDRLAIMEAALLSEDEVDEALQARLSEVLDRLTTLEAERAPRRDEPHSVFEDLLRRWERRH